MKLSIYNNDQSILRCVADKFVYSGTSMADRTITVTVDSATGILFAIGDNLQFRGETFSLQATPQIKKTASSGSILNGFEYTLIFSSLQFELNNAFLDYVLDNDQFYTGQSTVNFYGDVYDLARRIQANLNRLYNTAWTVQLPALDANGNITIQPISSIKLSQRSLVSNTMAVSVSSSTILSALSHAFSDFDFFYYIVGRVITIGVTKPDLTTNFSYGKGDGLYEIDRSIDNKSNVITRLYAYGGNQNLPTDYLQIPVNWVDYNNNIYYYYGQFCNYNGVHYQFTSVTPLMGSVTGLTPDKAGSGWTVFTNTSTGRYVQTLMLPTFREQLYKLYPQDYVDSTTQSYYGVREGSITFDDIYPTIKAQIEYYDPIKIYTADNVTLIQYGVDASGNPVYYNYTYPTDASGILPTDTTHWKAATRIDQLQINPDPIIDGYNASNILNQSYFYINLPDVGFDINLYLTDKTAQISMQSGACGGYTFDIQKTVEPQYPSGARTRILVAKNTSAEQGTVLPSGNTLIKAGDFFEFLNITLPVPYVLNAETRLQTRAKEYLDKYQAELLAYTVSMDEIYLANNPSVESELTEGANVIVYDQELGDQTDINNLNYTKKIIQTLTITYDPLKELPTYSITLAQTLQVGAIASIIQSVSQINNNIQVVTKNVTINKASDARNARDLLSLQNLTLDGVASNFTTNGITIKVYSIGTPATYYCSLTGGTINHRTMWWGAKGDPLLCTPEEPNRSIWAIPSLLDQQLTVDTAIYYIYIIGSVLDTDAGSGVFLLSTTLLSTTYDSSHYAFLLGVIYPVSGGQRNYYAVQGMAFIKGGTIYGDRIQSIDGVTYFDLDKSEIGGNIVFKDPNNVGQSLISGGYINTGAINADSLIASHIMTSSTGGRITLNAQGDDVPNTLRAYDINGNKMMELGYVNGVPALLFYNSSGTLVLSISQNGVVYASSSTIPASMKANLYYKTTAITEADAATEIQVVSLTQNATLCSYSAGNDANTTANITAGYANYMWDATTMNNTEAPTGSKVVDGFYTLAMTAPCRIYNLGAANEMDIYTRILYQYVGGAIANTWTITWTIYPNI